LKSFHGDAAAKVFLRSGVAVHDLASTVCAQRRVAQLRRASGTFRKHAIGTCNPPALDRAGRDEPWPALQI